MLWLFFEGGWEGWWVLGSFQLDVCPGFVGDRGNQSELDYHDVDFVEANARMNMLMRHGKKGFAERVYVVYAIWKDMLVVYVSMLLDRGCRLRQSNCSLRRREERMRTLL